MKALNGMRKYHFLNILSVIFLLLQFLTIRAESISQFNLFQYQEVFSGVICIDEKSPDSGNNGNKLNSYPSDIRLTNGATNDCDAPFEEEDGLLVVEMESVAKAAGWEEDNSMTGYTGDSYYEWNGGDHFSNPGNGVIEYQIKINNPGTYHFRWHNKIMHGTSTTESNDSWLRIPDADDFFAKNGSSVKYPNGGMFVQSDEVVNGASSDGWMKVYCSGTTAWTWSARTSDHDAHEIYATFDDAGVYTIQISGRSNHHAIDRFVLFKDSEYSVEEATDLANEETTCPKKINIKNFEGTPSFAFYDHQPQEITFSAEIADDGAPGTVQSVFLDLSNLGGDENALMEQSGDTYSYNFTLDGQEIGEKTVVLTAADDAGNINTASLDFIVAHETVFSVNCGGENYLSADGILYEADHNYSGGDTFTSGAPIADTNDDLLYQSERYGNYSYDINLPDGDYDVTLKMAETYNDKTGSRIFDVTVEDEKKIEDIDIYDLVGKNVAYDVTIPGVEVSDGQLNVKLTPSHNHATLSALSVKTHDSSTNLRVLHEKKTIVNIYPNPVSRELNIESKYLMEKIQIINTMGNCVMEQDFERYHFNINVSDLKNGIYFLRFDMEEGNGIKKFIKTE